ncbi:MAG: hypothetical protein J0L75_06880 [Spirochaetes bacterium]|nr:hypothetical protein [Spirochaetota bacterium]
MKPEDLEALLSHEFEPRPALVQSTLRRLRGLEGRKNLFAPRAPWLLAATTACLVFLAFGAGIWFGRASRPSESAALTEIRFSLQAPGMGQVALMGDFTQWKPVPMKSMGSLGEWEVRVKIPPHGRYRYLFLLDGKEMVPDPNATMRVDDGYGHINSVIKI